jgi:glycosyltransferase involved in cell wall biosynthesis
MHSIILTIHNKEWLIQKVLDGIVQNTIGNYELLVIIDGCSDNSEIIVDKFLSDVQISYKKIIANNIFETRANNLGLKRAEGERVIIVQDDMIIKEFGWNSRMEAPFVEFDDVFAVTSRTAHDWEFNINTQHLYMNEDLDNCWCDICIHTNHANRSNTPRDVFAVRSSVNRGPLMIDHNDLIKMDYLDEEFSPQDMDDHDLMYRMHKKLGKVCGCYWIDFESRDEWGGTRVSGTHAPWLLKSNHKNMKIFYDRHKDYIHSKKNSENRRLK